MSALVPDNHRIGFTHKQTILRLLPLLFLQVTALQDSSWVVEYSHLRRRDLESLFSKAVGLLVLLRLEHRPVDGTSWSTESETRIQPCFREEVVQLLRLGLSLILFRGC